jgi:hypothetical protein
MEANICKAEPVAKLLYPEKSMILTPFVRAAEAARAPPMSPTPCGLAKRWGDKRHQKGDFAGHGSFATGSAEIATALSLPFYSDFQVWSYVIHKAI